MSPVAFILTSTAAAVMLSRTPGLFQRMINSRLFAGTCLAVALLAIPKIVVSYIAPCEYLQDTVAAGELLAGRSAYPLDLRPAIARVLAANPPYAPKMLLGFQASQMRCAHELELNAHPPLLTVITEPLVATMGYYGPILVMNFLTLLALAAMLWVFDRVMPFHLTTTGKFAIGALLLGSQPVLSSLRMSNQSVILAALLVGAWYLFRQGKIAVAGAIVGLAAMLKVYPAIALASFLYRTWRGALAGFVVILTTSVSIWLLHGEAIFTGYLRTAGLVALYYRWMRNNYGLLSNVRYYSLQSDQYAAITLLLDLLLLGTAAYVLFRIRSNRVAFLDFSMALAATLMCLASPVVWTHYFIVLCLPLLVLSRYWHWWRSKAKTCAFLLLIASLNLHDATLGWFAGWLHTDVVWSIPTLGTLATYGLLLRKANKIHPSAADNVPDRSISPFVLQESANR